MKNKKLKKKIAVLLLISMILSPVSAFAASKEETVYSKMNPDGSQKDVIVNEHFFNKKKDNTIEDLTDLNDVININGDEKFSINDNKIVFESNGKDIFIQGKTNKELPISEKISYKLDGKDISLNNLLGKKGNVEITIKYTNNSKSFSMVNGKSELLYTPFVIATLTSFNNKNNSNVTVTNGRVVDTGLGYSIVALSTPGLYESLDLKELKDLDTVIINLDTDKFELPTIYGVATPKVLSSTDFDIFNKLDDMYNNIDQLESAMNELRSGSSTILTNLNKVSDGSKQISTNLNLVVENLDKIKNGTVALDDGLTQVVNSLEASKDDFAEMNSKLEEMEQLKTANAGYINGLNQIKSNYEQLSSYPVEALTTEQQAQLGALKFTYDNLNLGDQNRSLITVLSLDNKALTETIAAFQKVDDAMTKLNTYLPQLKKGADDLSSGTAKLKEGTAVLNSKMNELSSGTEQLATGMNTFNSGLEQFNRKGIVPILNVKNEAKQITGKVKALEKLSNDYQSFSLKHNDTTSSTKFVLVTEGKSAPKEETKKKEEKKQDNFFDRLAKLFS